jgi:hypothetical protein
VNERWKKSSKWKRETDDGEGRRMFVREREFLLIPIIDICHSFVVR